MALFGHLLEHLSAVGACLEALEGPLGVSWVTFESFGGFLRA